MDPREIDRQLKAERQSEGRPLTVTEYQRACLRTECDQEKSRYIISGCSVKIINGDLLPVRLIHAFTGITKEGGELLSVLEKWLYFGKPYTKEELRQKIKDELGDVFWYAAEACNAIGLDMGEVMSANVAKLRARYPDKFTEERAADENRNREAESIAQLDQSQSRDTAIRRSLAQMENRTPEQVLLLQGTVFGCCNRHADNQACDCYQTAVARASIGGHIADTMNDPRR